MHGYDNIYSMIDDLFEKDHLDGAMVDNFVLSASMDILQKKDIHVELELDYSVTYGKCLTTLLHMISVDYPVTYGKCLITLLHMISVWLPYYIW